MTRQFEGISEPGGCFTRRAFLFSIAAGRDAVVSRALDGVFLGEPGGSNRRALSCAHSEHQA